MSHTYKLSLTADIESCQRNERTLFTGLSVSIKNGDFIQVLGANGTGKTTLLKLLAGLNRNYKGVLQWQQQDTNLNYHAYAQNRVYLGHLNAIKVSLSALENLRWLTSPWQVKMDVILEALKSVQLYGYEETLCQFLSAGQKRRVALALLLCSPAKLWILDEPFTALDTQGVQWLIKLMQSHVAKGGAVVVTSHHALTEIHSTQVIELGGL